MSRIRLITLDLDNTLWDVDAVIVKAEQELVRWLGEHVPDSLSHYQGDALREIRDHVFHQFKDFRHDLTFLRTRVLYEVMRRTGLHEGEAEQRAQQAFEVFFEGRNRVVFFPDALEMLDALSRSFPIYALTNGNADIEKAGLAAYLSGAYSSADVGASKPHPQMFQAALTARDVEPFEAIHIGDHLVDDIAGASAVGMHSVWVNLKNQVRAADDAEPTREVSALGAVAEAVEQIGTA